MLVIYADIKTFIGNLAPQTYWKSYHGNCWRHVNSKQNQLLEHDVWWTGPSFMKNNLGTASFETKQLAFDNIDVQAEIESAAKSMLATKEDYTHPQEPILKDVSSWYKFIQMAAYVKHFINLMVYKKQSPAVYLTYY